MDKAQKLNNRNCYTIVITVQNQGFNVVYGEAGKNLVSKDGIGLYLGEGLERDLDLTQMK
jgi:hypothetical protein